MSLLTDVTLLTYATGVALLLLVSAMVLGGLRFACGQQVDDTWQTFRGWLIIVPTVLLVVSGGRSAIIVGIALISIMAVREFACATGLFRDWPMMTTVYLGALAVAVAALVADPSSDSPGWFGMFMALPAFAGCTVLAIPVLRNRARGQIQSASLAVVGFLYFGWMLGHLAFLVNSGRPEDATSGRSWLLFVLIAVALTDVASYAAGRIFGGRRLVPRVSPQKTRAGALGGLGVALLLPFLLSFSLPGFGWREKVLAGIIVGVGAPLGDLAISVIKRDVGIKDMGDLLPGHGGILDRVDSLILVAPLFFYLVHWSVATGP